jgi:hypothetical protein
MRAHLRKANAKVLILTANTNWLVHRVKKKSAKHVDNKSKAIKNVQAFPRGADLLCIR